MSGKKSGSAKPIKVLYDGWPLAYPTAGERQAALHICELLEALPEAVEPWLALPGEMTPGMNVAAQVITAPVAPSISGRLLWEQVRLPGLARRVGAQLVHTTATSLPVFSPVPCLVSPVDSLSPLPNGRGVAGRLRESLGVAGLSSAACIFWPDDLPVPDRRLSIRRLPPHVHSAFTGILSAGAVAPVEPYILAPGPLDREEIRLLAEVWSWISASLGEGWTLVMSDVDAEGLRQFHADCQSLGIEEDNPVLGLALPTPGSRAVAFRGAYLVLQIGQIRPWGDALMQAMACGKPVVGVETAWSAARVGPAGYLTAGSDPRGLSAAALTLITEEEMAERLGQAARQRATAWDTRDDDEYTDGSFGQAVAEAYAEIARGR